MSNVLTTGVAASLVFVFQSVAGPSAYAGDRHIVLTNNTREPIAEIYASDDRAGNWQEDVLGLDFLLPGKSVVVDIDDRNGNCRVDVKIVFDNGSDFVNRGVNACLAEAVLIR